MTIFDHLNIPDQWNNYWTKYPQGYTIMEALLNWVKQVDDMVDNQNTLNTNVVDYKKQLDDLVSSFETNLQPTVESTLKAWQDSGFLNVVIDAALQTQMDNLSVEVKRFRSNAPEPFGFITPYGDNQMTHPKVLYFPSSWNGFKYWMAYTPLPYYDETKENPCLVVSNDMINWQLVNENLHTGIVDIPGANDYNSDVDLVYRPDTNTLEVWYRGVIEASAQETIYRRTTQDGVTFTAREVMAGSSNGNILNFLSPAIIWDDTLKIYQIWCVDNYAIKYYETPDGKNWQYKKTLTVYFGETTAAWHIDVNKTDLGYEMLVCTKGQASGVRDSLFHVVFPSMTGVNYADGTKIIEPSPPGNWDDTAIYRSCLLKIAGIYYVFYGGQNSEKNYGISLSVTSEVDNIKSLVGVTPAYNNKRMGQIILSSADKTQTRFRNNAGTPEININNKWYKLGIRTITDFPLDPTLTPDLNSGMTPFYKYSVDGNYVHMDLSLPFNTLRTGSVTLGTLPLEARPSNTQRIPCNLIGANGTTYINGILQISWSGVVTITTYDSSTQWMRALVNGTYFLV
jgi:hypothetical protein